MSDTRDAAAPRTSREWLAMIARAVVLADVFILLVASQLNLWLSILAITAVSLGLYMWPFGPRRQFDNPSR